MSNTFKEHWKIKEGTVKENGRHKMYKDSKGIWTIGWGRNLERGLSDDEAEYLLANDMRDIEKDAKSYVGAKCWEKLNQTRKEVIMDMVGHMGLPRLRWFTELHKALIFGDYAWASREIEHSKYFREFPNRGGKNRDAMLSGQW